MEITFFYYNENSFKNRLMREKYKWGEEFAKVVMADKKLKALTTFVMANTLMLKKACASSAEIAADLGKVDLAGGTLLTICRRFGYWVCLIMCIAEIIKSLSQGDTKGIGKIVAKYTIGFATFYFLPWIFDLIKAMF
ncbi:hypothetical protein [Clostridium hydrogeniformans]|uniref:hypothetical protein n=1 Tax=Clostridium hydrogeniformans TaxID=349933 RepID=UPI0004815F7D|nr:hypothetical protein [Clostridium hydrogeniformans]